MIRVCTVSMTSSRRSGMSSTRMSRMLGFEPAPTGAAFAARGRRPVALKATPAAAPSLRASLRVIGVSIRYLFLVEFSSRTRLWVAVPRLFRELRYGEVRRMHLLGTLVNRGKKRARASCSGPYGSALQPEDPQQGSDSSSLMQMNHRVKTTPEQRGILGPAASPATGQEPPEDWPREERKDQRPKKHGVCRELVPTFIFFGEHGKVLAVYRVPVSHLLRPTRRPG